MGRIVNNGQVIDFTDPLAVALAAGNPLSVNNMAGEAHMGAVGGESAVKALTLTRPTGALTYQSGQLIANHANPANVVALAIPAARVNGGTGSIVRCRLSTNKTGLAGTETFRVHLFKHNPVVSNGDGGAFSVNGIAAIHLGYFEITLDRLFNDGAKGIAAPVAGSQIVFDAAPDTQNIYALIEARGTYNALSAEQLTVALEVLRD